MGRKKGSANFAGSLEVLAGAPLDARTVVDAKADLTAANTFPYFHEGITVYVKADKKKYTLIGDDPTVAANWKEEGGSQGSGEPAGTSYSGALTVAGWDSNTKQQTVTFTGYDASYNGVIGVPADATAAQKEAYCNNGITVVSQSDATVTFKAETIPDVAIPIAIYCGGGSGSGGGGTADFPVGGTTGQALVKASNADNDVEWGTINSIPDGGTEGQVLEKHYAKDKDVEWVDQIDTQKEIKNDGTAVTDRDTINFTDFDISDDSTNEETDVKPHKITPGEWSEIMSTLPGAPVQKKIYSPNEQVVGEWQEVVDGVLKQKPVYEKKITMGALNITKDIDTTVLDVSSYDIDVFITASIRGYESSNIKFVPSSDRGGFSITTNGILRWRSNTNWAYVDSWLIIQYTKTTDSWETV